MIVHGDCFDVLPTLDAESVDACVTDPPYGIGFMGREWDTFKPERVKDAAAMKQRKDPEQLANMKNVYGRKRSPAQSPSQIEYNRSIAGQREFQAWTERWACEVWRVLKPGAHLLVCGAPRSYHRMACGLEDAGFELRDCLSWLYGQGFPKSLDISKAIDRAKRRDYILAAVQLGMQIPSNNLHDWTKAEHAPGDEWWLKFKSVLTPGQWGAIERKVVSERRGLTTTFDVQAERPRTTRLPVTAAATDDAAEWQGWGTALKPAWEPIIVARKPCQGTVASNVQQYGTGGINVDGCRIAGDEDGSRNRPPSRLGSDNTYAQDEWTRTAIVQRNDTTGHGRWPANVVLDENAAAMLDEQSGELAAGVAVNRNRKPNTMTSWYGTRANQPGADVTYGDTGGASRFFYVAKPSREERDLGCLGTRGNFHPTVKPLALMRWLVRLVTPPGGILLDPFTGSGTTGMACAAENFRFVGIEREAEYVELATRRVNAIAPLFGDGATT